jgi:hypothetical protein
MLVVSAAEAVTVAAHIIAAATAVFWIIETLPLGALRRLGKKAFAALSCAGRRHLSRKNTWSNHGRPI